MSPSPECFFFSFAHSNVVFVRAPSATKTKLYSNEDAGQLFITYSNWILLYFALLSSREKKNIISVLTRMTGVKYVQFSIHTQLIILHAVHVHEFMRVEIAMLMYY